MKNIAIITALLMCISTNICFADSWEVVTKTDTSKVLMDTTSIIHEKGIVSFWIKKYFEENDIINENMSFMSIDCANNKYSVQVNDELLGGNIKHQGNSDIDIPIKADSIEEKIAQQVCPLAQQVVPKQK